MTTTERPTEQSIYEQMWNIDSYRNTCYGEESVLQFLRHANPAKGSSVIDFGCGTGRASLKLKSLGFQPHMLDFSDNCRDQSVIDAGIPFACHDLTKPIDNVAAYGICCDVMEHIQPDDVGKVLDNILLACRFCWFDIATHSDTFGDLIGHSLHVSVHDYEWWRTQFTQRECHIIHSEDTGRSVRFLVSAWADNQALVDVGVLNIDESQILQNIRTNIGNGWNQVVPCLTQNTELLILGGGPSLSDYEKEIKRKRKLGAKVVCLNGSYNWCLEHGITPSAVVIVDGRPFNARFTHPVVADCRYLIASQCDPSVLDGLPKDRTYLWHTTADFIRPLLEEIAGECYCIPGGSTVLLRAIPLLRMMGYLKYTLYGCDSCLSDSEHHAYQQSENNDQSVLPVEIGGRVFQCHPWMAAQSQEWISLLKVLPHDMQIRVKGDGLLSFIIDHAATMKGTME